MKLKNIITCGLTVVALALSLASCGESSYENHSIGFSKQYVLAYADQTADSVMIYTTDDWSFRLEGESWLKATYKGQNAPFSEKLPVTGYKTWPRIDFICTPNTTGEQRGALLYATSGYEKVGSAVSQFIQLPYLNISTPSYEPAKAGDKTYAMFRTYVESSGKTSSGANPKVTFTVYADGATLKSACDWITVFSSQLDQPATYEKNKLQSVELVVAENKTKEARRGRVLLTSNGITDTITVVQAQASDK